MFETNGYVNIVDLTSKFINQKSYYGKAKVLIYKEANQLVLRSYNTNVCTFYLDEQIVYLRGYYSVTTKNHQWDFLCQFVPNFPEVYNTICEKQKIKSFKNFLETICYIDLKNKTYRLFKTNTKSETEYHY